MKKNSKLLMIVGILLVVAVGIAFAYFMTGISFLGNGATASGKTEELIKVKYDAGTSTLTSTSLYPGKTASKEFKVTVTPGSTTNTATYAIIFDITENSFVYCNDSNFDSITNACIKGEQELIYTLKDSTGNVIKTGDLTGKTGKVTLAKEEKTVSSATDYNYTIEITFKETNADQNHNANKTIAGSIEVEYAEMTDIEKIIASKTVAIRNDFSTTLTTDTTGTVFTAEDDDGTSYYFAGNPSDNWVKLGNMYWRIVRINGDGTIRLIYNGTSTTTTGTGTLAKTEITYNTSWKDNMYVGYMYTSGEVHGYGTASNIKTELDSWYDSNLASYASKIDTNAGFCNDRVPYTDTAGATSGGGTGTTTTYYAARIRLITNTSPSFKCSDSNDLFTPSGSSKGNKKLSKPIGLITADEVAYAGGVYGTNNTSYYLYNNQYYWTLSPYSYFNGYAGVFIVLSNGWFDYDYVVVTFGVRPVINLKSDTVFNEGGTGTSTNPYVVS